MKKMDLPCCRRTYVKRLVVNGKVVMITCLRCFTDWLIDDLCNLLNMGKSVNSYLRRW